MPSKDNYGGFGAEYQSLIYFGGLGGKKPRLPVNPDELENTAKSKLSKEAFDYVAGGAGSESTVSANVRSFERFQIVPRMLVDVSIRDTRIDLYGQTYPAPFLLGPVGVLSIIHPESELAVARASSSLGIPFVLSCASSRSIEEVAKVMENSPRWFQLYFGKEREVNASFVSRAEASGYSALVVTLDTKILGWRERDLANAYLPFLKGEGIANYVTDPVFKSRLDQPYEENPIGTIMQFIGSALDPAFNWDDIKFLQDKTKLPIILKGVLSEKDVRKATEMGASGLIVSNHGGRQIDSSIPSLIALRNVVKEAHEKIPVLFDGGIRRGADVFKALALGAKAVLIGRPYVWGLAILGEDGVKEVVQNILADFDLTMALSGIANLSNIREDSLTEIR